MKINLEDPCTCGHTASWHGSEESDFPIGDQHITIVTILLHCNYGTIPGVKSSAGMMEGAGFDYTNFGRKQCECMKFRLDNLEFLRKKHEAK